MFPGKENTMNPTIQAVQALLQVLWDAADQDAKTLLAEDDVDRDAVDRAIVRQETIADVIEAVDNLAGGQSIG